MFEETFNIYDNPNEYLLYNDSNFFDNDWNIFIISMNIN